MHVERIEFDGFRPMDQSPADHPMDRLPRDHPPGHGTANRVREAADPCAEGPPPRSVSLIARNGQIRVSLYPAAEEPRRALISGIRQILRMPEYRSGAARLTFAQILPLRGLERRPRPGNGPGGD
ncbi:hypothetical protein SAMN04488245_110259 [Alloyangia pacifica]|uniref:Uncharacterized protein n=1 Tax=Alloyangia pacifica TaxID=311180 RepID=A0A1I6V6M2_9RHOB|nr:hypothetical protein SAMN04488245_110259 [Alloyangia pacifica]SFT09317.1 hypothetical protein SAMN04488050_1106 [Alloyangia pacifica]